MPRKLAAETSSKGAPTVHPGEEIAAAPIQGVSMVHPEEMAASASRAALTRGVSMVHPRETTASASPSQRVPMVQAAARAAPSGGGVHMVHPAEAAACSSAEMPCKKADLSSSGGVPTVHTGEGAMVYPGEWPEVMALRGGSEAVVAPCCDRAAQDSEESRARHHTKKARIVHEHPAEEAGAANDIDESDSDERVVDVNKPEWQIQDRHEAELLIEKLNQSGLGEDISVQEFLAYYDQLASGRPWIVLKPSLEEKVIDQQCIDHALCRFRYYKYKLTQPKEELHADSLLEEGEDDKEQREYLAMLKEKQLLYREEVDTSEEEDDNLMDKTLADNLIDKTEADFNLEFLEENSFFISFEKDGTELITLLFVQWDRISSRGAYQAIKIAATSFPNITPTLAYNGYYGCRESMGYQHTWLKEYDDLYFEIWRLVKKGTSFRAALEVVCELSRFPLRQHLMQTALGHDFTMTRLEKDVLQSIEIFPLSDVWSACLQVEEDGAKELIADAVKKRVNKPKFYDDYIRRKTEIAHIVGILPSEKTETDATV
ncbi:hypothetical protein D1007_46659 [Hordeum vulgare]|nr:hypothetical protein D1007_46659 [Hordeum vulgare]